MSFRFKPSNAVPRLSDEEQVRQGRIVRAAQAVLADTQAVRDFLNNPHAKLRGRPLELATRSQAGLAAVEAQLRAYADAPGAIA